MRSSLLFVALSLCGFLLAGCGQSHSNNPAPPQSLAPAATTADTSDKDSVSTATSPTPVPLGSNSQPIVTNEESTGMGTSAIEQQIGFQQNLLFQERAALDKALRERNNEVHLGPEFMDAAAYGLSSGLLTWDFLRRTGLASKGRGTAGVVLPPAEVESAITGTQKVGATAAAAVREVGPIALKTTEAVSAAVLGIFFFGKSAVLSKDVMIRFTDTNDIRIHRAKVREAEKNLAIAKANLAAIYFPQRKTVP